MVIYDNDISHNLQWDENKNFKHNHSNEKMIITLKTIKVTSICPTLTKWKVGE